MPLPVTTFIFQELIQGSTQAVGNSNWFPCRTKSIMSLSVIPLNVTVTT